MEADFEQWMRKVVARLELLCYYYSFAQTVLIKLVLLQAAQLSIFVCGHRPKAKEFFRVVVVLLLVLHLVHFLIKRNLREKNLPSQDLNLGPPESQFITLPTERQRHCYFFV